MNDLNVLMIREVTEFDLIDKKSNLIFYYIIKDTPDEIMDLKPKVRNLVKRCFNVCDIRKICYRDLCNDSGYEIYKSAYLSYKNNILFDMPSKKDFIANIIKNKDRDYWAVYLKDTDIIIAYAINICYDNDTVEYASMKVIPQYLKTHFPYYGLIFEMNKYYLGINGKKYVTDGAKSLTEHSNVQEFLCQKFGFRKAYCRLKMHYKWWLYLGIKCLFPFRNIIKTFNFTRINLILKQESWTRTN